MKYLRAFLPALLLLIALAACANPTAQVPAPTDQATPEATQPAEAAQPTAVDQAADAPAALTPKS